MTNELNFASIELMETTQASFDYSELENPMGERRKDALRLDFDRKLKVEFHVFLQICDKTASNEKLWQFKVILVRLLM